MSPTSPGLAVFSPRPMLESDAPAALRLMHAYDVRFLGEPMVDLEDLLSELRSPGVDLATDSVTCWSDDGTLVGVVVLGARGRIEIAVAADQQPLRAPLLERCEDLARSRSWRSVHQFVSRADDSGARFLGERGYGLDYTAWILNLDEDTTMTIRELPPDYRVRPFLPADAEAVFTVIRDAFGEWERHPRRSFLDWQSETLERPGVDPGHFRVATHDGDVIGACIVYDSGAEAWVSQLATRRDHRGRGVAQRLLAETFGAARERGLTEAGLSTDTRTGALDLYLRLGMSVRHTVDCWTLDLAGGS